MPGPAKYTKLLLDAVNNWQVEEAVIDKAVRRVLRLVLLSGRMDQRISKGSVNTVVHQALARRLAEEAITLLKNEGGVLPLKGIESLAIIGPNAAEGIITGGGSSHVHPPYEVSPLEALRKQLSQRVEIIHEAGSDNFDQPSTVPQSWMMGGMKGAFFGTEDIKGEPIFTEERKGTDVWFNVNWLDREIAPSSQGMEPPGVPGRFSRPW